MIDLIQWVRLLSLEWQLASCFVAGFAWAGLGLFFMLWSENFIPEVVDDQLEKLPGLVAWPLMVALTFVWPLSVLVFGFLALVVRSRAAENPVN